MIIKALGVSSLMYLASNINVPKDSGSNVNGRLFRFIWKNKRDRIKREGLYQDYDKGGLRITDISKMIKALRTIGVDSETGHPNLKFAPEHSCLYNKKKITQRLGDMNFIFSW